MSGSVVTFYSYKGGVGRSFALANMAVLLGRWGFRVLCIDWDLEAPGLAHFFGSAKQSEALEPIWSNQVPGLVELLTDFEVKKQLALQWRDYVIPLPSKHTPRVSLLKAGRMDPTYTTRLHKLNWAELYTSGLGDSLENMFKELRQEYDYVLIDARTGVTDFSGIITAQLPDILAFLFTSNEQSFKGATDIARRAVEARNELNIDRSRLLLLPIPARFEIQFEHEISSQWQERFAKELKEFYEPWTTPDIDHERLVQSTTIPYVPIWSFGERLSVAVDSSTDPFSINYSLETIAALLAHRLGQTRLLLDSRDEFVSSARRVAQKQDDQTSYSIFLSYAHEDSANASALASCLEQLGLRTFRGQGIEGEKIDERRREIIDQSAHMVVLLGKSGWRQRWQAYEVRTFLRQAATDESARLLIPLTLHDMDVTEIPDFLRHFNVIQFRDDYEATAKQVLRMIQPTMKAVESAGSALIVRTTTDGDIPIKGVSVCALAKNGTTINALTDQNGSASLQLLKSQAYTLLIAHPRHPSKLMEKISDGRNVDIRIPIGRNMGSLVIHSTGHIPGLNGRLNPILDTSNRTYLYADNIAINGGQAQPTTFVVNEPFELEDAQGSRFEVRVKLIVARTTLLDYRQLT